MPSTKARVRQRAFTRRRFIQSSAALGAPWMLHPAQAATTFEAYTSVTSAKPGETLRFFARDPAGSTLLPTSCVLEVSRFGAPDLTVLHTTIAVYKQSVPSDASVNGCRWPAVYSLVVPTTWRTGLYYASFGTGAKACYVPFVVRPAQRRAGVNVLVQIPVNTVQAYNNYGGKSLYDFNSTGGVRASSVSFDRPLIDPKAYGFDGWTATFVHWLEAKGYGVDYCTSIDLHREGATLLSSGYKLFMTAGHDEYWSLPMRQNLDAFVAAGGNAAILSGCTSYWQVRFADSTNRSLVCYKSAADPSTNPATKTINWRSLTPSNPENSTFGLSFFKGASWTSSYPRPQTPFVVRQPAHWAFAGLSFSQGASFGAGYVGYETDAADFRTSLAGQFHPTGLDGSPATLRILAQADASDWNARAQAYGLPGEQSGYGAVAVFSRGGSQGTVFNAGSTDWVYGFTPELNGQAPTPLSLITQNVIAKLSATFSETAEVRRWSNNPGSPTPSCYFTIGAEVPAGKPQLEGTAFVALAAPAANTTPVYRFHSTFDSALSGVRFHYATDPNYLATLGWVLEGVAFHAYASQTPGSVPVYQFRRSDADGRMVVVFSTSADLGAGWTADGPAFFVPAA